MKRKVYYVQVATSILITCTDGVKGRTTFGNNQGMGQHNPPMIDILQPREQSTLCGDPVWNVSATATHLTLEGSREEHQKKKVRS